MSNRGSTDRGAVLVMAVFVAILLVGVLYHVAGVGGSTLERQLLQDGADAAAFSAATVNARGMNILALLNLIMVAILTILVALKLVQAVLVVLLVVVSTTCAIPPFAGCGLVVPMRTAQSQVGEAADAYQNVAKGLIEGLTQAGEVINEIVPFIALAEGIHISTSNPTKRVAEMGVVWPVAEGLPTQKGSYGELCARAGRNITVPVELILPAGVGDFVGESLGALLSQLTARFSRYFCGDDGNGNRGQMPESSIRTEDVSYPPGQYDGDDLEMWNCNGIHPTEADGRCHSDSCKTCAELGCNYCYNRMRRAQNYKSGLWTVVRNEYVTWVEDGVSFRVPARGTTLDRWSLESVRGNPCRRNENPSPQIYYTQGCVAYSHAWQWNGDSDAPESVPSMDAYSPRPICENRSAEPVLSVSDRSYYRNQAGREPPANGRLPEMMKVRQTLYVALVSCTIEEEIEIQAEGESLISGQEEEGSMAPRVLDPDRFPGEAEILSILRGSSDETQRKKGVAVGFGREVNEGRDRRYAFAAAEYYSMDSDSEAMWHMRWLSRLVRYQLDGGETQGTSESHGQNNQKGLEWTKRAVENAALEMPSGLDIDDFFLH